MKEADDRVKKLLSKVNDQTAELSIAIEKAEKHTALFNYQFDLNTGRPTPLLDFQAPFLVISLVR